MRDTLKLLASVDVLSCAFLQTQIVELLLLVVVCCGAFGVHGCGLRRVVVVLFKLLKPWHVRVVLLLAFIVIQSGVLRSAVKHEHTTLMLSLFKSAESKVGTT